jgi:hypothetical protein
LISWGINIPESGSYQGGDWLLIIIIICAIPAAFAIGKYIQMMGRKMLSEYSSSDLAIRPIKIETHDDSTEVTLKIVYTGDKKLIIEELSLKSRLTYLSSRERILAWVKLIMGYFTDDVDGLKTVFGNVSPTSTWIIGGPVYRIKNRNLRKPLSVLLGLITVYFFIFYLIPIFWPLLWSGPYLQVQQIARDGNLMLHRGKVKVTTPFILDPGTEEQMTLQYCPSSMTPILGYGSSELKAKVSNVNESPETKLYRLPRANEFTWKTVCSLYVKINAESARYRTDIGTGKVHLEL